MPKMFIHSVIFSKCYILDRFVEGILGMSRECTLDGALAHHTPVHTLVHTWGNLPQLIHLHACFWEVGGNQRRQGKPTGT